LAEQHLRILTQAPHIAGSAEDRATADYVAAKFRQAGLATEVVEYRVWMNYPVEVSVDITSPAGVHLHAPTREQVEGDRYQDDRRVVMPFCAMSPSGDVEAEVVFANYATPEDFDRLRALKIDVRGKIVLARYGQNFRGVKALLAQQHGAVGLILYSDPFDNGGLKGDKYPQGRFRPDSGVQRGSVGYTFRLAGDPTTPGRASLPSLPESGRISPKDSPEMPAIPTTPLSYNDARPILENLAGVAAPGDWQGSRPHPYYLGPGPVRLRLHLKQDYRFRTIWNVVGRVEGREAPQDWVIAGNHRDAWVYGAVDPISGTAAMLEALHGLGDLLKSGWRPKRTIVFASWDGEEYGLIGSTEWGEEHAGELRNAVAYFNMDAAVSGPNFGASSVPSLKRFLSEIAGAVPGPQGKTVYQDWTDAQPRGTLAPVGDLGGGSDYAVFLEHLGVPATDIASTGAFGVYHSVFDNYDWFIKFADPDFLYEQQMARVFGLEVIRMADADVLPYDYEQYGKEIVAHLASAEDKDRSEFGASDAPDCRAAVEAAHRFEQAGRRLLRLENSPPQDPSGLNRVLLAGERALLIPEGLPGRPWYRHSIYDPGEYTGYAAVTLPGVNEAIDRHDIRATRKQIKALAAALNRAANVLTAYR
jgi:N-acetylated-alpha-linked acidic dipeptidase